MSKDELDMPQIEDIAPDTRNLQSITRSTKA